MAGKPVMTPPEGGQGCSLPGCITYLQTGPGPPALFWLILLQKVEIGRFVRRLFGCITFIKSWKEDKMEFRKLGRPFKEPAYSLGKDGNQFFFHSNHYKALHFLHTLSILDRFTSCLLKHHLIGPYRLLAIQHILWSDPKSVIIHGITNMSNRNTVMSCKGILFYLLHKIK